MLWGAVMASTTFSDEQVERFAVVAAGEPKTLHFDQERPTGPCAPA